MKKRTLTILITLFFIGSTAMAWGGGRHRGGHHGMDRGPKIERMLEHLTEALSLTEEQIEAVEKIKQEVLDSDFYKNREERRERGGSMHTLMKEQLTSDTFDTAAIKAEVERKFNERLEHKKFMIDKMAALHQILTAEQREQLSEMIEKKQRRRGFGRSDKRMRQDRNPNNRNDWAQN